MPQDKPNEIIENDISVHIFSGSATMIAACLTVVGIFRLKGREMATMGDELLAVNAAVFLLSCFSAYLSLKSGTKPQRHRLAKVADFIFLAALLLMAAACGLIAYEFI